MDDSFVRDALREVDALTPGSPAVALPEPKRQQVRWPIGAVLFDERNQQFVFRDGRHMDREAWDACGCHNAIRALGMKPGGGP